MTLNHRVCCGSLPSWCYNCDLQGGGCHVITPSGHTITLHRRQRTYWLKGRISTGEELEVLTIAAVSTNPEVQGRPIVAHDLVSQFFQSTSVEPEQQDYRGDRELLRETDGETFAVAAKA